MFNKILIVEDDKDLAEGLRELLLENGYSVETVFEGSAAIRKVEKSPPDLVILDLGLPDISGETVCQELKKYFPELPIIILTAKNTTANVVRTLNIGADDFMAKPFELDELLARIKARLRGGGSGAALLKLGDLSLDSEKIEVKRANVPIHLTQTEFKLLECLMRNPGRVLSREMLLNRVWSYTDDVETRVVDVYIGYLRKKIDKPYKNKLISCIRGFGYMITSS